MEHFQPRNWDEFRWESEIRRDERRICAYFSAVLDHLDMPDEEESISRTVAAKKELISDLNESVLHCWSYLAPDPADEDEESDEEGGSRVPTVFSSGELMIDMLDDLILAIKLKTPFILIYHKENRLSPALKRASALF